MDPGAETGATAVAAVRDVGQLGSGTLLEKKTEDRCQLSLLDFQAWFAVADLALAAQNHLSEIQKESLDSDRHRLAWVHWEEKDGYAWASVSWVLAGLSLLMEVLLLDY